MKFLVPKNSNDKRKFLKLNGITVPVSINNTGSSPFEAGTRERGYRGDYFMDRCKIKQDYGFEVCLQSQEDACAFEGLLMGEGESFPFTDDEFSCKGAQPISDGDFFVDKEVDGKFQPEYVGTTPNGAFTGTVITNISDVDSTDSDFASWTTSLLGVGDNTAQGFTELTGNPGCVQITAFNASSGNEARRTIRAAGLSASTDYVVSFYLRAQQPFYNGTQIYAYLESAQITSPPQVLATVYNNGWTRFELPFTTNIAGAVALDLVISLRDQNDLNPLIPSPNPNGSILLIDAIQLQSGRLEATKFVIGSTSPTQAVFDASTLRCGSGATISFWYKLPAVNSTASMFELRDGDAALPNADWRAELSVNNNGFPFLTITRRDGGFLFVTEFADSTIDDDEWHLITLTMQSDSGSGPIYSLYIDGGLELSLNPDSVYTPALESEDLILRWTGVRTDSLLSDLQILPYVIPAKAVGELYESGIPQGCAPEVTMEGLIDKRKKVQVVGQVSDREYVSVHIDNCWVNNAVRLTASLFEV